MLPVRIVATAELLFFDIRDRLDASSWIMQLVKGTSSIEAEGIRTLYRHTEVNHGQ
jgi:hypothetical protein